MDLTVIAAVAEDRTIGDGGGMPWHIPEDLERFRGETSGHPVILGRVTHESIVERKGSPLNDHGRVSVVMTRDPEPPAGTDGVAHAGSVGEALALAESAAGGGPVFVAGGASVYEQFLPLADRMLMTQVDKCPRGDTRFPAWNIDEWQEVSRERRDGFDFVEYERRMRFY